jgi:hypothetical protein
MYRSAPNKPRSKGKNNPQKSPKITSPSSTSTPTRLPHIPTRHKTTVPAPNQPRIKRVHQERLAKTGIVGAGPTGLTVARVAQVMGYQSPITLIDHIPPVRVDSRNNKRNHPLLLTTSTLDALSVLDPRLYRRLLSLGRFDTFAGYLDWDDKPVKLLSPQDTPRVPYPRWVNHLCLPRDAYGFAVLTTPLFDLPQEYKDLMKKAIDDPTIEAPPLPQIGINIGRIVEMTTPLQDPLYKQTLIPVIKLTPKSVKDAREKVKRIKEIDHLERLKHGHLDDDDYAAAADDDDDGYDQQSSRNGNKNQFEIDDDVWGDNKASLNRNGGIDDDHDDDDHDGTSYRTKQPKKRWSSPNKLPKSQFNDDAYLNNRKHVDNANEDSEGFDGNKPVTKPFRTKAGNLSEARRQLREKRNAELKSLTNMSEGLQQQLEFNMVIAADGLSSDLYKFQYKTKHNSSRLLPSPNNNIRCHGWCRTSELKNMIGSFIGEVQFDSFDAAYRRVNSRIWTRKMDGIRFTSILMDYAPLHLTDDVTYRPKDATDLPDWIYWELQVAESIWKKQTNLPVPILPATNNVDIKFQRPGKNQEIAEIDALINGDDDPNEDRGSIDDGVMMFHGAPIKPIDLLQLGQLSSHPLIKTLISSSIPAGLTVEKAMYTPVLKNLHRSSVHDHVMYCGNSAYGSLSDNLSADSLSLDHAIITALTLAANGGSPQANTSGHAGPEFLARQVGALVDKTFMNRGTYVQKRIVDDSVYYGETREADSLFYGMSQLMVNKLEQYFPPPPGQQAREYESLYRFNPLSAYESTAAEQVQDILVRNRHYRESVLQGFMDGSTRKVDFGDIPLKEMDFNGFNPKFKPSNSPFLPPKR